jgi:ABC-type nitrate/sulfonate/bicarbonate transport system permease component
MKPAWHLALVRACSVSLLAAGIGLWALASSGAWISPAFLPSPEETARTLSEGLQGGELAQRTSATVQRMFYGWMLSSLLGVALGALVGLSALARTWLLPTLELLRPLPASSLVPVGIALVGLSNGMVIGAVVFGAIWPVLLATTHGFTSVEPRLREVARVLGIGSGTFAWKLGLPNALPDILAGMRLSLTASLIVTIVGEMLSAQQGLGTTILHAARSFRAADLYAGVIMLAAIGFASTWLLERAERRLLRWRRQG